MLFMYSYKLLYLLHPVCLAVLQISEAMKIGARAIKRNTISVEEVNAQLQELDWFITDQKQINEAIGSNIFFLQLLITFLALI